MANKDLGSLSMDLCEKAYGSYQTKINDKSSQLNQTVNELTSINSLLQQLRDQENNKIIELNNLSENENDILKSLHIDQRSFSLHEAENLVASLERLYSTINQVKIPACQRELDHNMRLQNEVIQLQSRIIQAIKHLYEAFNRRLHQ